MASSTLSLGAGSARSGRDPRHQNYDKLVKFMDAYTPSAVDVLGHLRSQRKEHGDDFCVSPDRIHWQRYLESAFWGTFPKEIPRDKDGFVLLEDAVCWIKGHLDDFYKVRQLAPYARAMQRMEVIKEGLMNATSIRRTMERTATIKEELMAAVWHPRRIERLLEIGGEAALDNFAGV